MINPPVIPKSISLLTPKLFFLYEFIERVSQKEGVDLTAAATHAKAVFIVLASAVTPGEFADVRANFSEDYKELFANYSGVSVLS